MHYPKLSILATLLVATLVVGAPLSALANGGGASPVWSGSGEQGDFSDWNGSTSTNNGSVQVVTASSAGIPSYHGDRVVKATTRSGGASSYARPQLKFSDTADVSTWGQGDEVWYGGAFYFPSSFWSARQSGNIAILRWDAYDDGSSDMQGGVELYGSSNRLRIMTGSQPFGSVLETGYVPPADEWVHIEVHQILHGSDGSAHNEIFVDGVSVGSNDRANFQTGYPSSERGINRLRTGIVSQGGSQQTNELTMYHDRVTIADGQVGPTGTDPDPEPEPDEDPDPEPEPKPDPEPEPDEDPDEDTDNTQVQNLRASDVGETTVSLAWDEVAAHDDLWDYQLQRRTDGGDWETILFDSGTPTTFDDDGLTAGTDYAYRVRAREWVLDRPYSETLQVTTDAADPDPQPEPEPEPEPDPEPEPEPEPEPDPVPVVDGIPVPTLEAYEALLERVEELEARVAELEG